MSSRKTKLLRQKQQARKTIEKKAILELKEYMLNIQTTKIEKLQEYKLCRKNAFCGIAKEFSKVAASLVITVSVVQGLVWLFGGGIPFYPDKFRYSGVHYGTFDNESGYSEQIEYERTNLIYQSVNPSNTNYLEHITSWEELEIGRYQQIKYTYNLNRDFEDIIKLLSEANYNELLNILELRNTEYTYKDSLTEEEINTEQKISGCLFYRDKEYIYFEESPGLNIGGGIAQISIILIIFIICIACLKTKRKIEGEFNKLKNGKKEYYSELKELLEMLKKHYQEKIKNINFNEGNNMTLKKEIKNLYESLGDGYVRSR